MVEVSSRQLQTLKEVSTALFQALAGKLSPHLLSGKQLNKAFNEIKKQTLKRGMILTPEEIGSMFQLPTSLILHQNWIADVLTHLPIRLQGQTLQIYKLEALPFMMNNQYRNQSRTFELHLKTKFIAANPRKTLLIEMYEEDFVQCSHVVNTFFCPMLIQKPMSAEDSCLVALFQHHLDGIDKICEITTSSPGAKIIRINHFTSFVSTTDPLKVFFECNLAEDPRIHKQDAVTLPHGTHSITTSRDSDCVISSPSFSYRSYAPLSIQTEFNPDSVDGTPIFNKILGLTAEEINQGVELIEQNHPRKVMKINEIKNALQIAKDFSSTNQQIGRIYLGGSIGGGILSFVVIVISVAICSTAIYYCAKKKKVEKLANIWMPSTQPPQAGQKQPI